MRKFTIVIVITLLAAACGADGGGDGNAAVEQPGITLEGAAHVEGDGGGDVEAQNAVFVANCAVCHGAAGEGGVGPPLAGHTPEQIRRQVRSPIGPMPVFTEAVLPDTDVDLVIAYVKGLGEGGMHLPPPGPDLSEAAVLQMHHFMALSALNADNIEEAAHHVTHITEVVEGVHLKSAEDVLASIDAGDTAGAEATLEEMLVDNLDVDAVMDLHLPVALQALVAGDVEEAGDDLTHSLDMATDPELSTSIEDIIALLDDGDVEGAEAALRDLVGADVAADVGGEGEGDAGGEAGH